MRALACALVLAVLPAANAAALQLHAPRWTRAQMEARAAGPEGVTFVYGTQDPATAPLWRARALAVARRMFGADSSRVLADRDASEAALARTSIVLFGGPRENAWTSRLAPALPVEFTRAGFRWRGTAYERPGDLLALRYPSPLEPRRFVEAVSYTHLTLPTSDLV